MEEIKFKDFSSLTNWLVKSEWGQRILRDAVFSKQSQPILDDLLQQVPAHVLVKCHGDGFVEVFGSPGVRAKIIELPYTEEPLQELILEKHVANSLPEPYKAVDWPSSKKAVAKTECCGYERWKEKQAALKMELSVLDKLTEIGLEIANDRLRAEADGIQHVPGAHLPLPNGAEVAD
jgi:hypothetical protein